MTEQELLNDIAKFLANEALRVELKTDTDLRVALTYTECARIVREWKHGTEVR
jgi:hypothetical protein